MTPRRMSGIWINDFEGSRFLPTGSKVSDSRNRIWLDQDPWGSALPKDASENYGKRYAVTFIGRMTVRRGAYGHFGGWTNMVLVDRLLSIHEVSAK